MLDDVRKDPMMSRLLDALQHGEDIGHYGRLVFLMVARHFAGDDELLAALSHGPDEDSAEARTLLDQVKSAGYSPPKRDKILDFSNRQNYQIIANPGDPDAGNVYKDLQFPDEVYEHIAEYREQKAHAT